MLSSRPGKALQEWPDSAASIGGAIFTSRIGRRQAWRACGPARESFEQEVQPLLENILERGDLDDADFLIKLYMIGRQYNRATPIILICCMNQKARENAEQIVRDSGLLEKYPGYGLGASALPLEGCDKLQRFAGVHMELESRLGLSYRASNLTIETNSIPVSDKLATSVVICQANSPIKNAYNPQPQVVPQMGTTDTPEHGLISTKVLAATDLPEVGRRLYIRPADRTEILHQATGGVILQVGGFYCQLTVHHLYATNMNPILNEVENGDLDVCHFDRREDDDIDFGDIAAEYEITSRGSLTPQSLDSADDEDSMKASFIFDDIIDRLHNSTQKSIEDRNDMTHQNGVGVSKNEPVHLDLKSIGRIFGHVHNESSAFFDYGLVQVTKNEIKRLGKSLNRIDTPRPLRIRRMTEISSVEVRIIVAMSTRFVSGILFPDRISYRRHGTSTYQKIYQVELDQAPVEGDCGSSVVDKETGDLYGHLILGDTPARIVYIVPATDLILDIPRSLGLYAKLPSLPSSNTTSIYKHTSVTTLEQSLPSSNTSSVYTHTSVSAATTLEQDPLPRMRHLPCEFWGWSGCDVEFPLHASRPWIDHNKAHLQNKVPKVALCWFCDQCFDLTEPSNGLGLGYEARMLHIRDHIIHENVNMSDIFPDFAFAAHLHMHRLITNEVYNHAMAWREAIRLPNGSFILVPNVSSIYDRTFIPANRSAQQERAQQLVVDLDKERRAIRKERKQNSKQHKKH